MNDKVLGDVGSVYNITSATFTRPADTTAYTAGDAVSDSTSAPHVLTFDNCARLMGGTGSILGGRIIDSANVTTLAQLELYLFSVAPAAKNDNAAVAITDAETLNLVGIIDFNGTGKVTNAGTGAAGNAVFEKWNLNIPFECASGSDTLYGLLVARNAYAPISGEQFTIQLGIVQS